MAGSEERGHEFEEGREGAQGRHHDGGEHGERPTGYAAGGSSDVEITCAQNLNVLVDNLWPEISTNISAIEALYEDETFYERHLAALVASKVFYYLGELNDSLTYALGAGP